MSGRGSKWKKTADHYDRHGPGRCEVCGERAVAQAWVTIGEHERLRWMCEPHYREFKPKY